MELNLGFNSRPRKRKAVSPVIATLLLIAIAVAAAIIVYSFVTGLIGGLSTGAGSNQMTLAADVTVPGGGAGTGTVVLTLRNAGSVGTNALPAVMTCNVAAACDVGSAVTFTPATLSPGQTATASYGSSGALTTGTSYTFSVTVTYPNGSTAIASTSATVHG